MNLFGKRSKKEMTPWEAWRASLSRRKRKWDRIIRHQKFFFYTTFVLPVFAVVLAIKVVKTYVRIKLRAIAMAQKGPEPEAASKKSQSSKEQREGVHCG